jgi:hypothetical protein
MRRLHWGAAGLAMSMIGVGCTLLGWLNKPMGAVLVLAGIAILFGAVISGEREIAALDIEPNVYVEFNVLLDEQTPDAPFVVHNDGPGTVHDVQISALEFDQKVMTFDLIPNIRAGDKRVLRKTILDPQGKVSVRYSTMLSFVRGQLIPRNFGLLIQDRIKGEWSRLGDFEDVVIPFTVTFRRQDGRAGVRSHQLIFELGPTRRAYVRALPRRIAG